MWVLLIGIPCSSHSSDHQSNTIPKRASGVELHSRLRLPTSLQTSVSLTLYILQAFKSPHPTQCFSAELGRPAGIPYHPVFKGFNNFLSTLRTKSLADTGGCYGPHKDVAGIVASFRASGFKWQRQMSRYLPVYQSA